MEREPVQELNPYWLYYNLPTTEGADDNIKITTFGGEAIPFTIGGRRFDHVSAIIENPLRSTRSLITLHLDYLGLYPI